MEGERIDFQSILAVAQRFDVRGYAIRSGDKIWLLLENNPGRLHRLRAQVKGLVQHALPRGGRFSDLPPLMALDVPEWATAVRGAIDRVSPLVK